MRATRCPKNAYSNGHTAKECFALQVHGLTDARLVQSAGAAGLALATIISDRSNMRTESAESSCIYTHALCQTDPTVQVRPANEGYLHSLFSRRVLLELSPRSCTDGPRTTDRLRVLQTHPRSRIGCQCIAALDQWARTPRYDSLVVSAGNALRAKVMPVTGTQGADRSAGVDVTVHMQAFAKLRQQYVWVPVTASCGVWHKHVIPF